MMKCLYLNLKIHRKGEGKSMKTNEIIRRELDRTDLTNAEETQFAALLFVESGEDLPLWLEEKILKRCRKYGFRFGEVVGAIASSPITAAEYAKSATRQSVAEKTQIVNFNKNGLKVEKLPGTGPNALRLLETGELVYGSLGLETISTKSIDSRRKNDFIFQKYTNDTGGGQDNQGDDVVKFLKAANKYVDQNKNRYRFVAVLDGPYYKPYWRKFAQYTNGRVLVETSDSYINKCKSRTTKKVNVTKQTGKELR